MPSLSTTTSSSRQKMELPADMARRPAPLPVQNAQLVAGMATTLLLSPRQRLKVCCTQCLYNCLLLLWCFSICAVIFACCSMLASPADRSHAWQPDAPLVFEPAGSKVATAPSQCSWARIWNPWRKISLSTSAATLLLHSVSACFCDSQD